LPLLRATNQGHHLGALDFGLAFCLLTHPRVLSNDFLERLEVVLLGCGCSILTSQARLIPMYIPMLGPLSQSNWKQCTWLVYGPFFMNYYRKARPL
jgi:hypothetical protein